ncbi:MAG: hypothetical protein ACPIA7_00195 [Akkermansiaceae bacterium]
MSPSDSRASRNCGDQSKYYLSALTCAQSLWLQGKPAQALLQLNHALAVQLSKTHPLQNQWPPPYQAIVWILSRRHEKGFMGNPVRHYQHLASRMSGPNREQRTWRAWACFHLAQDILPPDLYPRDQDQIDKEQLTIPCWNVVIEQLEVIDSNTDSLILKSMKYSR